MLRNVTLNIDPKLCVTNKKKRKIELNMSISVLWTVAQVYTELQPRSLKSTFSPERESRISSKEAKSTDRVLLKYGPKSGTTH